MSPLPNGIANIMQMQKEMVPPMRDFNCIIFDIETPFFRIMLLKLLSNAQNKDAITIKMLPNKVFPL